MGDVKNEFFSLITVKINFTNLKTVIVFFFFVFFSNGLFFFFLSYYSTARVVGYFTIDQKSYVGVPQFFWVFREWTEDKKREVQWT